MQLEDYKYMLEIYKQKLCTKLEKQRLIYNFKARQLQKRFNETIASKFALDTSFVFCFLPLSSTRIFMFTITCIETTSTKLASTKTFLLLKAISQTSFILSSISLSI